MTEGPPKIPDFESAEQAHMIDPRSGYFKAIRFSADPVAHMIALRESLLKEGYEEAGVGIQAISELAELEDIIESGNIEVTDERLQTMLQAEYASEAWALATFSMLKEAGFTKAQLMTWFEVSDECTAEERMRERGMLLYIHKVFDDDSL